MYDQLGEEIYRDGVLMPEGFAEPVFSDEEGKKKPPKFSGIYLRQSGEIISRSGKTNKVKDKNVVL